MITQDEIKSVARKHALDVLTKANAVVGVDVSTEKGSDGQPQFTVTQKLGTVVPTPEAVDDLAEIIARTLIDVLPRLTVETKVACTVSGSVAEGKGHGTIS